MCVSSTRQGQKLLRVDFDTSAGDETYTSLKASLEMAKQLTKLLAEALICPEEGGEPTGEAARLTVPNRGVRRSSLLVAGQDDLLLW